MSTAAPACTRSCGKHPQERVVGVCSACLANKLSSLVYTSTDSAAPENFDRLRVCSPRDNSHLLSTLAPPSSHHHPHLQTINEEADSTGQAMSNDQGLLCSTLKVEVCPEAELGGSNLGDQSCVACDVAHRIEEGEPIFNPDVSSAPSIHEAPTTSHLEEGNARANPYLRANNPIKCKRSKSLCGLSGDSLFQLEHQAYAFESAATTKSEQSDTHGKKVTLRNLFQLDDDEKWRSRAPYTSEFHRFSADYKPIEEELDKGSSCNTKQTEEAKDVHDNDNRTHNSRRCVPSASTLSSSVCPSMPGKLKHSVLLNSLLCRKVAGDERKGSGSTRKSSQAYETSRRSLSIRSLNEGGLAQASDEGALVRATYIASESKDALRRCRSELERSVARSSVSSSQPSSPPCFSHIVDMKSEHKFNADMKSERKFNLTARVLAAELPSILCSSAQTVEATAMIRSKSGSFSINTTQMEDCRKGEDLRLGARNDSDSGGSAQVPTRLQSSSVEAKAAISVVSRHQSEEHQLAQTIANTADEDTTPIGSLAGIRKVQGDDEIPLSKTHVNIVSVWQGLAGNATETIPVKIGGNLDEAHHNFCADAAAQEVKEAGESPNAVPAYVTVSQVVGGRSLSCSSSSGKAVAGAGQQESNKLAEEWKKEGGWAAYTNKLGKGGRKWPPSGKIAPAQSGLLRFYLTPLRASSRTRFTSTRRPPKRHFWSLIFV